MRRSTYEHNIESRTRRRPERRDLRIRPRPAGRGLRRGTCRAQRPRRPQARGDRALPDDERRRRGARVRAPHASRGLGPRRRPQRRRPRRHRRRRDDRPRRDEGDRDRSRSCNRDGRRRRAVARAERRRREARTGGHRRRGLGDGNRRVHARRRPRLADGEVRARGGQPRRGRARHRRGRHPSRRRRGASRSLLGASRRRRELRHRDVVHVPPAPRRDDRRRADRASDRGRARAVALLPRRGGGRLRTN